MTKRSVPESWRNWLLLRAESVRYRAGVRYLVPLAKFVVKYRGERRAHLLELEYIFVSGHRTNAVAEAPEV